MKVTYRLWRKGLETFLLPRKHPTNVGLMSSMFKMKEDSSCDNYFMEFSALQLSNDCLSLIALKMDWTNI